MNYCPNCGERKSISKPIDQWQQMDEKSYWKTSVHECTECYASYINYDDGVKKRLSMDKKRREADEREILSQAKQFQQAVSKARLHNGLTVENCTPREVNGKWFIEVNTNSSLGVVLLLDSKESLPIPLEFKSEAAAIAFIKWESINYE